MKLQLNKIVEILSRMKGDDFYFKNYAPEIIESYTDEIAEDFFYAGAKRIRDGLMTNPISKR